VNNKVVLSALLVVCVIGSFALFRGSYVTTRNL